MTWSLPVLDYVYVYGESEAGQDVLGAGQGEAAGVAEELPRPGDERRSVREWLVCTFLIVNPPPQHHFKIKLLVN